MKQRIHGEHEIVTEVAIRGESLKLTIKTFCENLSSVTEMLSKRGRTIAFLFIDCMHPTGPATTETDCTENVDKTRNHVANRPDV